MSHPAERIQTESRKRYAILIGLILGGVVALSILLGWFVISIATDGRQNGTALAGIESRYPKEFPSFDAHPDVLFKHILAIDFEKVRPESEINWLLDLAIATDSQGPGVRALALTMLGESIGKKRRPKSCRSAYAAVCIKLLEDDNSSIRGIALDLVCEQELWRDPEVKARLLQIRDHDPDPTTRLYAHRSMKFYDVD